MAMSPENQEQVRMLADRVTEKLENAGVKVFRTEASTGTIYLSLDYGMAYDVRISDHEDRVEKRYRYNLLTCRFLHNRRNNGTRTRLYYQPNELYMMINAILSYRSGRIKRLGVEYYDRMYDRKRAIAKNKRKHGGF